MDTAALIVASIAENGVSARSAGTRVAAPGANSAALASRLFNTASVFFLLRNWITSNQMVAASGIVVKSMAIRGFVASKLAGCYGLGIAIKTCRRVWNTGAMKRLRRKLVFEFVMLVLGPSGNAFFLMIFWPGWWLLGTILVGTLYLLR